MRNVVASGEAELETHECRTALDWLICIAISSGAECFAVFGSGPWLEHQPLRWPLGRPWVGLELIAAPSLSQPARIVWYVTPLFDITSHQFRYSLCKASFSSPFLLTIAR